MIVDDFDLDWLVIDPGEAHPVLIVDPNAVLAIPITGQSLQTVAWWNPEIFETLSGVELVELASRHSPESLRATAASVFRVPAIEDVIGTRVFKRADHDDTIARLSCYVKALPSTGWSTSFDFIHSPLQLRRRRVPGGDPHRPGRAPAAVPTRDRLGRGHEGAADLRVSAVTPPKDAAKPLKTPGEPLKTRGGHFRQTGSR